MEKLIDLDYSGDTGSIQVSLCRWDSVTAEQGQIDVEDLVIGAKIKLLDEGNPIWAVVKSTNILESNPSMKELILII